MQALSESDYQKAKAIWSDLVDQEEPLAKMWLGQIFLNGLGVEKDETQAFKLTSQAASSGLAIAQYELAVMFRRGEGAPKNNTEAARYFRLAAEGGGAVAQYNLGSMLITGNGLHQDIEEGIRWTHEAAKNSLPDAEYKMAWLSVSTARSDEQNTQGAFREWLEVAVKHNHPKAHLAFCLWNYLDGEFSTAAHHLSRVVTYGDHITLLLMKELMDSELPLGKNKVVEYVLLHSATEFGFEPNPSHRLETLSQKMSQGELARGQDYWSRLRDSLTP